MIKIKSFSKAEILSPLEFSRALLEQRFWCQKLDYKQYPPADFSNENADVGAALLAKVRILHKRSQGS